MKKVDKLSGDKNEFSLNHNKPSNKTIIDVSTSSNDDKSIVHIEIVGIFNHDELFCGINTFHHMIYKTLNY